MSKFAERMGWTNIPYKWKFAIVWSLLLVVADIAEDLAPGNYELRLTYTVAIVLVLGFVARWVVGPSKQKKNVEEERNV